MNRLDDYIISLPNTTASFNNSSMQIKMLSIKDQQDHFENKAI